ncbi:MAG: prepilin-type N-terminal cleavage/methylation domain-containing protein [Planctomycetes bacterium]|nr:prepilin-type N-terminal cleavage/methylation domain-containing protein [Planctomycetota bacterium]
MRKHRSSSGFTLVEILIALVLLMVGIVGILSIFPVGIKNVTDSVEDSTAANIGQSLYNAMTEAMRRPNAAGKIVFAHDGLQSVGPQTYTFDLPAGVGVIVLHPTPGSGTDSTLQAFQLGMDARTSAVLTDIQTPPGWSAGGDPSEPLRQYSYQFEVQKPPEALVPTGPGTTTPVPLYQFRFMIYRQFEAVAVPAGEQHPNLVKDFNTMIAGAGL